MISTLPYRIQKKTFLVILLCQLLSTSSHANLDSVHTWCKKNPGYVFLGGVVATIISTVTPTSINFNNKKTAFNNLAAENASIGARYRNATQFASAKRNQTAQEQQSVANLNCMLTQEPGFQEYVGQRCPAEIFSGITDPTAFLNDRYGLTFYSPSDYTTRSLENIYRTETYVEYHPYDGTVRGTREVIDYQRIIDTIYTQAGTSIQGQSQRQTGCDSNSTWSLIANTEQTRNTWDRNDQTHYYNRITLTTALNFLAMTQGVTIQTGKSIVDKNSSLTQAANRLIDFIRSQCQTVPQRLAWNRTETERSKTAHQVLLTRYQSELPGLEAEQRLSQGMFDSISTQATEAGNQLEFARLSSICIPIAATFAFIILAVGVTKYVTTQG